MTDWRKQMEEHYAGMDYQRLLDLAIEALNRTNMHNAPGHPEDLAAHLVPAIECVAVGMTAGMELQREIDNRQGEKRRGAVS